MQIKPIETKESNHPQGREMRSYFLELKASDDGSIEGYGSVFGVKDSYDDIVAAGAFNDSLTQHKAAGTLPVMLWQHDSDKPMGVWTEMVEDQKGLFIKGQIALETVAGKEAYALLKMGVKLGFSIGFMTKRWSYDAETDVRTVLEVDLWEVSLVTFPANKEAMPTSVKAGEIAEYKTFKELETALRDAGFSQSAAKSFISQCKSFTLAERDAQGVGDVMKQLESLKQAIQAN